MKRPFVIGLTGSIGMGKSTTAALFAELGIPIWDADAAVSELYEPGGVGTAEIEKLFPEAVTENGVDRIVLRRVIAERPMALSQIEAVIHPLVAEHRQNFIDNTDADIVVLDIPLLFEVTSDAAFDHIVVVSAPVATQRDRVLARPGMTPARFDSILERQMTDAEKRSRADSVIETISLDDTRVAVESLVKDIRQAIHARNRS